VSIVSPPSFGEEIHAEWTAPGSPPSDGYEWILFKGSVINEIPVTSGTTTGTSVNINGLDCATRYRFKVRSVCDSETDDVSAWVSGVIYTPACDAANEQMTIVVAPFNVVNGGNDDWKVQANIVSPIGVTLDENVVIFGTLHIIGVPGGDILFSVTILAGNTHGETGVIGSATNPSTASVDGLTANPATATGSDANEYDINLSA
jgi:hypothetical protein